MRTPSIADLFVAVMGNRPARRKERRDEHPVERRARAPLDAPVSAPAALSATRPLYWSVRRELWENRSIYVAPLVVAAVVLFGFLISTLRLPAAHARRGGARPGAAARRGRHAVQHGRRP